MTERIDQIGFGGLELIQEPAEFCYGVDAVILADFAARQSGLDKEECGFLGEPVRKRRREASLAVDLGTGTGIIPFILSYKTDCSRLIGVEVQAASQERALRSRALNRLEERMEFIHADVKDFGKTWGKELRGAADLVTCNPPYTIGNGGLTNANTAKAIARHETTAGLAEFMKCAAQLLHNGGDFFLVHRPSRLADICCMGRACGLEPKELCFVSANRDSAANILLVHMIKGGGPELRMLRPLYIYDENGAYTEDLRSCYR